MSEEPLTRAERWTEYSAPDTDPFEVDRVVLRESSFVKPPTRWERYRKSTWSTVVSIVLLTSPVAGAAAPLSSPDVTGWWNGLPLQTAIVAAGVSFLVSILYLADDFFDWFTRRRRRRGGEVFVAPIVVIVCGVVTLWAMSAGRWTDSGAWGPWSLTVWAAIACAVVTIVGCIVVARPVAEVEEEKRRALPVDLADLPPEEADRLYALRNRVLDRLVERGHMSPESRDLRRSVPFGRGDEIEDRARESAGDAKTRRGRDA